MLELADSFHLGWNGVIRASSSLVTYNDTKILSPVCLVSLRSKKKMIYHYIFERYGT